MTSEVSFPRVFFSFETRCSLVTQPMLQRRPNRTELRSMDSYIQILCSVFYVMKNHPLPPQKEDFFFGGIKSDFSLLRRDGGGIFRLHFLNLHKMWI